MSNFTKVYIVATKNKQEGIIELFRELRVENTGEILDGDINEGEVFYSANGFLRYATDRHCFEERLGADFKEYTEIFIEDKTPAVNPIMEERRKLVTPEIKDQLDAEDMIKEIPQFFCMRGDKDRAEEVKAMFLDKCSKNDNNIQSIQVKSFNWFNDPNIIIFLPSTGIDGFGCMCAIGKLLLATQTLHTLPPLEVKKEVEEFWLKYGDGMLYRDEVAQFWRFGIYDTQRKGGIYLPFIAETEPLIWTKDKPTKEYKFMGVKPYFETK